MENNKKNRSNFLVPTLLLLIAGLIYIALERKNSIKQETHQTKETPTLFQKESAYLIEKIDSFLSKTQPDNAIQKEIMSIRNRVVKLQKQYDKTSSSLFLLGPFGALGVVFKEKELEEEITELRKRFDALESSAQ